MFVDTYISLILIIFLRIKKLPQHDLQKANFEGQTRRARLSGSAPALNRSGGDNATNKGGGLYLDF